MYKKMSIDFGTSNTVVAFWDEEKQDVILHPIPDVTLPFRFKQNGKDMEIPYIPSMIYYESAKKRFIGYQVIEKSLERTQGAFRWMKAYIQRRRSIKQYLPDGTEIDCFQAAKDFLENIVLFATEQYVDISNCEVIFPAPIECFEYYTDWLSDVCLKIGIKRYRFIDESSACIFGYDTHLQPGDIFLIFDFGGGTLDVSIVRIEEQLESGRGCRVLGKAGCHIGGRTIDMWLYEDLLKRTNIHDVDARQASGLFMLEVEKIKETLSFELYKEYDIVHQPTGLRLKGKYHRAELEDILEEKGLYLNVQETIHRALSDAETKGITKEDIKEALLVGGTSQIPSVRRQITSLFGKKTRAYRPYDVVARGAVKFLSSEIEALYDYIQHDYAIKSYDSKTGTHQFIPLIPRGTRYPTREDFKKITLKAVRDDQRFFGIDIYEIAQKQSLPTGVGELIFDLNGGFVFENQLVDVETEIEFWMNEEKPTFIEADPPAKKGEKRFLVSFSIDTQKRLLIKVRDIKTQKLLYQNYPVVKLR